MAITAGIATIGAGAWLYYEPKFDSIVALLAALVVLVTALAQFSKARPKSEAKMGKGGSAIRMDGGRRLSVDNRGSITGGKGGTGGDGGDAIHAQGIDLTIVNNGVIAGGDAGMAVPAFNCRWVNFRFPIDSGLQQTIEAQGMRVAWVNESRAEVKLAQGWEYVEEQADGQAPTRYGLKTRPENQLLMKYRR